MPGTLTIPNPQQGLSGNVPAVQLDQNWNTIRDYINAREVTLGTLGARPAPSVAGRFYFATDTQQGFVDTGTAWVAIGAPSGFGTWAVRRATGLNNAVTPLTQYDVAADAIQLRNPTTGQTFAFHNPGTRTNNILTAGPAVNGRDQAGVFSPNTFIYLYYVSDGTTLGTITSVNPPTTGPVLPGGYTMWAYHSTHRLNASTQFLPTRVAGSWVFFIVSPSALAAGPATVATAVDVSALVPPTALAYMIQDAGWAVTADGSGAISADLEIHLVSGNIHAYLARPAVSGLAASGSARTMIGPQLKLPNIGQQFFYKWTLTIGTSPSANITVAGYQCGNGGE
jgi:hypothetical protein